MVEEIHRLGIKVNMCDKTEGSWFEKVQRIEKSNKELNEEI